MPLSKYFQNRGGVVIGGALDANGDFFPLDSCSISEYEDASGNITSIVATDGVNTWTQNITYSAVNPKRVTSQWVKS